MPKHSGSHIVKKGSKAKRSHDLKSDYVKGSNRTSDKRQTSQGLDIPEISTTKKGC